MRIDRTSRRLLATATALAAATSLAQPASAFDFFEHRYVGEVACRVLATVDPKTYALLVDDPEQNLVSCGYINPRYVAIAGDHSDSISSMMDEAEEDKLNVTVGRQTEAVYAWLSSHSTSWDELQEQDIVVLTQVMTKPTVLEQLQELQGYLKNQVFFDPAPKPGTADDQGGSIPGPAKPLLGSLTRKRPDCFAPPKSVEDGFARLSRYVELAMKNSDHFGWAAQDAFLSWQKKAIDGNVPNESPLQDLSYAAHFLGDQYAAGHIRVERRDLAPAVAKYQHDWDNRNGVSVRQSFFEGGPRVDIYWRSFGDSCLLRPESRATRLLATFALIQAARNVGERTNVAWTRPIALTYFNEPVTSNYTEHFNVTLGLGGRVPFSSDEVGASPIIRTRVGLEYLPPLFATFIVDSAIEITAARQIVLKPFGAGFHGDRFIGKLSPAVLRWSTSQQYFELGPQLEAGYAFDVFSPLELRWTVVGTPFFHRGAAGTSVDYDIETFAELVYRFDR